MYLKKSSLMNLTLQRLFRFSRRMIPMTKPCIPKLVCFHLFVRYFITKSKNAEADLRLLQHPKMERFVIIVNGWKPSTIITKRSILHAAAALDQPRKCAGKILSPKLCGFRKWYLTQTPAGIYLLKVNHKNISPRYKKCSRYEKWCRSGVFIVNFEHIFTPCSSVSIANVTHVIAGWEITF